MALTPQAVPHDGIDLAYTAADISQMHALLKQRGHFQFPMRCVLNRCDWDLIHNFVAPQMDQLSQLNPATHAALLRLLVKVHEQREWCDKFPTLLQGSDTDKTPVMLNWRGFQVRDQGT